MPRIAITMGDPAGIGPEIILKAVSRLAPRMERGEISLLLIGCYATYAATADALKLDMCVAGPTAASRLGDDRGRLAFVDVGAGAPLAPGSISAEAGQAAYEAVRVAVELTVAGVAGGICTAPLSKQTLNMAGHSFAGHTELLSELTGSHGSVMMLAHGGMRVSHVSTHNALADAAARLTPQRLDRVVRLTQQALETLGISSPRIAIAALNPHAGEGGLFGSEDIDVTEPAVARFRSEGLDVSGPVPGDTVFVKLRAGQYDAVVAMYHDQGHIPVKLLGFEVDQQTGEWKSLNGVNVTLGLPIIRTSVDHGTAFDIAGRGVANESSLIEAIEFAARLIAAKEENPGRVGRA